VLFVATGQKEKKVKDVVYLVKLAVKTCGGLATVYSTGLGIGHNSLP
jgi:hypothetical protein